MYIFATCIFSFYVRGLQWTIKCFWFVESPDLPELSHHILALVSDAENGIKLRYAVQQTAPIYYSLLHWGHNRKPVHSQMSTFISKGYHMLYVMTFTTHLYTDHYMYRHWSGLENNELHFVCWIVYATCWHEVLKYEITFPTHSMLL